MKGKKVSYINIKFQNLLKKQMSNKLDRMFQSDFVRVPRPFIRKFNLNTAIMLSEIYSEYRYWFENDALQEGGWFFSTIENMYYNTGLSKHQQLVACKELVEYGIIKIKYHGMPKKRYFKLNVATFNKLFQDCEFNANKVDVEELKRKFSGFSF